ncbi:MAG: phage tail tape measure protein [Methylobacter sp.]
MASNLSIGIAVGASVSNSVGRAFQSIDASATRLGRSLQSVRIARTATDDVIRFRTRLEELTAAQRQLGGSSDSLQAEINETSRRLADAERAAGRLGVSLGNITQSNRQLMRSEQTLGGQLARNNTMRANRDRRSEIGGQAMGVLGMVFAAAQPIKAAMAFESVMADVRKVIDLTDTEFKGLGKSILDMSSKMPMAASGIGAIVATAGQSGIAKTELLGFTQAVVKMGVAFDMSGEEAGQTMASWRAGMAISQKQVESLADAINFLDANMNASAKNISEVVQRQGAVAKAAGLTEIQIAALSASLLNSGTTPEIAATALKNLTNALTKGGSATKAQVDVFKQLGMTSEQVTAGMQKDAETTIKSVFDALAKTPAEIHGSLVGDLFGEDAKGAIMPLLVNLGALKQAFDSVGDASKYAGSMEKEYQVRSKTTDNAAQLLENNLSRLGVNLGSVLLPTLNNVFGAISIGAGYVSRLAEKFPMVTEAIVGVSFGLLGLKALTLAAAWSGTIFSSGWTMAVSGGIKLITASQWLWNAALGFGLLPIAAIGIAVVGAVFLIYKYWTPISSFFTQTFTQISATAIGWKNEIVQIFNSVVTSIKSVWEPIMAWFTNKFDWLAGAFSKASGFASKIGGAVSLVGKFMSTPLIGVKQGDAPQSLGQMAKAGPNATLPAMAGLKSSRTISIPTTNSFHITQKPGEDQNALAERIAKKIEINNAKAARGALHD